MLKTVNMAAYICYCQKLALICINSTIFCTDFSTLWDGDCQLGANCISKTVHLNKKETWPKTVSWRINCIRGFMFYVRLMEIWCFETMVKMDIFLWCISLKYLQNPLQPQIPKMSRVKSTCMRDGRFRTCTVLVEIMPNVCCVVCWGPPPRVFSNLIMTITWFTEQMHLS